MGALSLAWGIVAFVTTVLGFLPCLSPINWFNLPFSAVGVVLGAVALARAGTGRAVALVGFVCCTVALGVSIVRLVLGAATF